MARPRATLPVSVRTHGRQPRVVLGLRPPERYAEVEQRLIEQAPVLDEQGDQQPPDAAVAVQERVDRLELHVREPGPHLRRRGSTWRWRRTWRRGRRVCLTVVVYSLNMLGDAVRDLLDPRLRGRLGRYGAARE